MHFYKFGPIIFEASISNLQHYTIVLQTRPSAGEILIALLDI